MYVQWWLKPTTPVEISANVQNAKSRYMFVVGLDAKITLKVVNSMMMSFAPNVHNRFHLALKAPYTKHMDRH
ncbi:hypothetical protein RD01_05825 [Pectobacterium carotovorum subsp. carotovorum]|nr:hypothetical protein RD01_05825 [Pectobacterium carotovorum subsp. carotovorum]